MIFHTYFSYKQITNILSLDLPALATACLALGIEQLCDQDIIFLREYKRVLQPIAEAITFVEGNTNTFGVYLPTLFGIRTRLRELHNEDDFMYCQPLLEAIRNGFSKRFAHLMTISDMYGEPDARAVPLFLAMLTNPCFKMSFIPTYWFDEHPYGMQNIQNLILNALKKLVDDERKKRTTDENANHSDATTNQIQKHQCKSDTIT